MAKFMTIRLWILLIALFLAVLAINPSPMAKGIQIKHLAEGSPAALSGISGGETLLRVNSVGVETLAEFAAETEKFMATDQEISVTTLLGEETFTINDDIGFTINEDLEIVAVTKDIPIESGDVIEEINNKKIESQEDFEDVINDLLPTQTVVIQTDQGEYAFLTRGDIGIIAEKARTSNINKGLELQGGTRVLLQPVSEEEITTEQVQNLILVLQNRLNVYGLSDLIIRPATDLDGTKFVLVEIAGVTREEVRELIGQQGVFEAKIGEEIVFEGGKKDIPFVCKDDGSCAGIVPPCTQVSQGYHNCQFQFSITLSTDAAKKHADITGKLGLNQTAQGSYLEKSLDLYLDGKLVDSLLIGASLKGQETTQIAISGPGFGPSEEVAFNDAVKSMEKLQTILITGSLPLQIEIVKLDTISPSLGKEFIDNAILAGFLSILAVAVVIFIRYRRIKIVLPMVITTLSEVLLILGVAALIGWNLDLAAIAGIIAAVGTGVDDQIVITDEVFKKRTRELSWKEKIKRAFFIIMAAYGTTVAAMLPLWNAGAGLLRGFALTTIIGVSIGVFITRPAFASMIEKFAE